MYSKDESNIEEIFMEVDMPAFEDMNTDEVVAFLNLAAKIYSPCALLAAQDHAEKQHMIDQGIHPLTRHQHYYCSPEDHETAKNEPLTFIIYTIENEQYYINSITLDKEKALWVQSREEIDNTNELQHPQSTQVITANILSKIHNHLLPLLDSVPGQPNNTLVNNTDISIYEMEFISNIADYFKSLTQEGRDLHITIYQKINTLLQNKYLAYNQTLRNKLLEKSCIMLASEYYISGSKEHPINEAMLKRAFQYLQQWVALSPNHGDATRLASRMFTLLQGAREGKQISLVDTTVLGHDVIKNLVVKNSYEDFTSIAKAMGVQYQNGFNDGKISTQSKEGLQRAGIFAIPPMEEEVMILPPSQR